MRIASHMLAYNVSKFLPDVIDNAAAHVDKLYVALPSRPWGYRPEQRESQVNPTRAQEIQASSFFGDRVEIIEGDWPDEDSMRNACLDRAEQEGFSWFITQDADEFYTEQSWRQIRHFLATAPEDVLGVRTTWYNFWKSAQFVIVYDHGAIKSNNANFAIRCGRQVRFTSKRIASVPGWYMLDTPCFHFGWALSDAEMRSKVSTWGHTNEFDPERWYRLKWGGWTEATRNLHPVHPTYWQQAIRTPFELPDFAQKYAPSLEGNRVPGFRTLMEDIWYDLRHDLVARARILNRTRQGGTAPRR